MSSTPFCCRPLALLAAALCFSASSVVMAAEKLPADVAAFVDRSDTCMHWAGEEAYDKARGRQIQAAFAKNRCDTLEQDGKRLQKQHAQNPAALKAIRNTLANWQ